MGRTGRVPAKRFLDLGQVKLKEERWSQMEEMVLRIVAKNHNKEDVYSSYVKTSLSLRSNRYCVRSHSKKKVISKMKHLQLRFETGDGSDGSDMSDV